VSSQTLRKRLHERLVLVSTDESRQTLTVRRKLAEQQRSVLHVHIQTLSIDPEKPDKPDIDPEPGRNGRPNVGFHVRFPGEINGDLTLVTPKDSRAYDRNVGNVVFSKYRYGITSKIDETAENSMSGLSGAPEKPDMKPDIGEANRVCWEEI
jgi:hypothetical protein